MNLHLFQSAEELSFKREHYEPHMLGTQVFQQDIDTANFILIGIEESDYLNEANLIRQEIYKLYTPSKHLKIADVGNYNLLAKEQFSFEQLAEFISQCYEQKIIPIVFGGSRKIMYVLQKSFAIAKMYQNVGLVAQNCVIRDTKKDIVTDENFLWHILQNKESYLFQFAHIGYQTYLQDPETLKVLKELSFETIRLGKIRDDLKELEPSVRNVDLLGVSINALKFTENGGQKQSSPNGLYNEELAQLFRYAGMSNQLKCLGLFDFHEHTHAHPVIGAQTLAQSFWCFLEGYLIRKHEQPNSNSSSYTKYTVTNDELQITIQFFKSEISGRWWMKIPKQYAKLEREFYLPCSLKDYETAMNGDVPERWLKGFHLLG